MVANFWWKIPRSTHKVWPAAQFLLLYSGKPELPRWLTDMEGDPEQLQVAYTLRMEANLDLDAVSFASRVSELPSCFQYSTLMRVKTEVSYYPSDLLKRVESREKRERESSMYNTIQHSTLLLLEELVDRGSQAKDKANASTPKAFSHHQLGGFSHVPYIEERHGCMPTIAVKSS
jgi:hypothetical protein